MEQLRQSAMGSKGEHLPRSMPAFGSIYSESEIAAVVNYVTKRFGAQGSTISAKEVAELRSQTSY